MNDKLVKFLSVVFFAAGVFALGKLAIKNWLIASIIFAAIVIPICIWIFTSTAKQKKEYKARGWTAKWSGDSIIYYEMIDETERGLKIEASSDRGETYIRMPGAEKWLATAPDWAKNKRDEIFSRIREIYPQSDHTFYINDD